MVVKRAKKMEIKKAVKKDKQQVDLKDRMKDVKTVGERAKMLVDSKD